MNTKLLSLAEMWQDFQGNVLVQIHTVPPGTYSDDAPEEDEVSLKLWASIKTSLEQRIPK